MTKETGVHVPTEEFRSALEWEVSQALRHEVTATALARSGRQRRFMFIGSLAATLAIGVVLGAAPAQIQDAKQRDSLMIAAQADLQLANARLRVAEESFRVNTIRVSLGMLTNEALANEQATLHSAQQAIAVINLNLEEIRASSAPPSNHLAAPLVGQRDFVKERLQLGLTTAQRDLSVAEQDSAIADRRQRVGSGSQLELEDASIAIARARAQLQVLLGKIALRERFFRERLAAATVAIRGQIIEAQQELVVVQRQHAVAETRLKVVQEQEKLGTAARAEVLKAELDVLILAADVTLITRKLQMLEDRLRIGAGG